MVLREYTIISHKKVCDYNVTLKRIDGIVKEGKI